MKIKVWNNYVLSYMDWVFDETLKMTYDNPVFIEQKKRKKEAIDDSGFVRQYKLDESEEVSIEEIFSEDEEEKDNHSENVDFDPSEFDTEDDAEFDDSIPDEVDDATFLMTEIDKLFDDEQPSIGEKLETGPNSKPAIKFNIKTNAEEKKQAIKFNIKWHKKLFTLMQNYFII